MRISEVVWSNGELLSADDACLSIYDAGLLHGVGLFETMRSYGGKVFRLADHLDRLFDSASALGIVITQQRQDIEAGIDRLLEDNKLTDARLRLTVTRGSVRQVDADKPNGSTLFITAASTAGYPEEMYRYGMCVLISPYKQNVDEPTAGHKTLNYFGRLIALQQAQQNKAGEALWFTPTNRLSEGSISNVFIVKGHKLMTPGLEWGVLPGIARKVVLELAQANGIESQQCELTIDDLFGADEVFLTNSIMELMPVRQIERHEVGDGKPGEMYRQLHELYRGEIA